MPEALDNQPFSSSSPAGLRMEINANGSLRRFDCESISLTLFVGNEIEGGPTNLYLRRRSPSLEWIPLLGPSSPTRFRVDSTSGRLVGAGTWQGIDYEIELALARSASVWFWHVRLENTNPTAEDLDLTYAQDIGLAPYGAIRLNEYYVSQYIDHSPLTHATRGMMIASRQNQAADGRHPWSLIGSLRSGTSFATDALQLHGLATRADGTLAGLATDLPGGRLQHEHSMAIIRDTPIQLGPRESIRGGFFGWYRADHPDATSQSDLEGLGAILSLPEATPPSSPTPLRSTASSSAPSTAPSTSATLFSSAPLLDGLDLDTDTLRQLFGSTWRHEETDEGDKLLSFFHGPASHVILRAKELRVLRPHGHILRTGRHLTPDETALTSTVWMSGTSHSMLTQGHVSINRFLSTTHTYLSLFRSHGQRVFAEIDGAWQLLNVPSAFEISPQACRWIYRHGAGTIQVRAEARSEPQELTLSIEVSAGKPVRFLISHHIALNDDDGSAPGAALWSLDREGISVAPAPNTDLGRRFPKGRFQIAPAAGTEFQTVGGDELLFADGRSRRQPFVCIVTKPASSVGLRIRGRLIAEPKPKPLCVSSDEELIPRLTLRAATGSPLAGHAAHIAEIAPWYTHNALVHYLSPRGLEQYSGGGWGTRDVCQGPVEMLLALHRPEPIRDLLLRVMGQQNADGDWPQWFMFFDRERDIRPDDSHGDIVFWPLLVLSQYLIASGDKGILDEQVRFFDSRGLTEGELTTVWQHVQRALQLIEKRVIPDTSLAAYGHGDWNDSLQPLDPAMRDHMCSAWTVTLHFQTLTTLAQAMRAIGRPQDATRFEEWAQAVQRDFQRLLLVDGVLTGYAVFENGRARYLLHPSDQTTGVQYSSLAMIHAIIEDMLTPAQTREHLRLIDTHLSAPDGVRLFNCPMPYHGGLQRLFQRAETATFFGREIGLMYTHAHLRYAQALAHVGDAERFFRALCQANPIGIRSVVPAATLRQMNCYYSSSDAAFDDRYHASTEYDRVANGTIPLDGGWRVYSSGAGIALGLILRRFLGLGCEAEILRVDPVIPPALDGLRVETVLLGRPVELVYRVGHTGCGVTEIVFNGQPLTFERGPNPHRPGAALVAKAGLKERLNEHNTLEIRIG